MRIGLWTTCEKWKRHDRGTQDRTGQDRTHPTSYIYHTTITVRIIIKWEERREVDRERERERERDGSWILDYRPWIFLSGEEDSASASLRLSLLADADSE